MKEFIKKLIGRLEEELKLADEVKEKCARENPLMFDNAKGYSTGIANAKSFVNQLAEEYSSKSSSLENDSWIPCSDMLPEDGQTVLVQDFEDYYEVCNCETRQGVKGFSSGDWWASANNYLAWMPLPTPYHP